MIKAMKHIKKHLRYYIIYTIYVVVFGITFNIGVFYNPYFSLYDFFMSFASELLGITFTVVIVESYIRLKTEQKQKKNDKKYTSNTSDSTKNSLKINDGINSVKCLSTIKDEKTGVQYLLVEFEDGRVLTPLLDNNGKPI
jgi:hypothetical protein